MSTVKAHDRILKEPDFVNLKRFDFSLEKTMERYPDGAPTRVIAQALLMSEEEVLDLLEAVVLKLRDTLKVVVED